jgi:hypothetical protein
MMLHPPVTLKDPIIGKLVSSRRTEWETYFEIEEGTYQDHIFVRAGERQKGQDAIIDILKNQLDTYVKVCDPYISVVTIKLISNVPPHLDVLILTKRITDLEQVKKEISHMENKTIIKQGAALHDRFIFTKGEGWFVGHSLKDFGTKNSQLSKLVSSVDPEASFDETWHKSSLIFNNKAT